MARLMDRLGWQCFMAACCVTPLVFWRPASDAMLVPQWAFLWTFALAALAAFCAAGGFGAVGRLRTGPPLGGMVLASIAGIPLAFRASAASREALGLMAGASLAWLAPKFLADGGRKKKFLLAFILANTALAAYAGLQFLGLDPLQWSGAFDDSRPFATMGNPNFLGGYFAVLGCAAAGLAVAAPSWRNRAAWSGLALAAFSVVLAAQTRGAWLAAGAGLLWAGWKTRRLIGRLAARRDPVFAFFAAALVGGTLLSAAFLPGVGPKAVSIVRPDWGQYAHRAAAARAALLMWREHPILGMGGGSFRHGFARFLAVAMPRGEERQFGDIYSEPWTHSDILQNLAEGGVLRAGFLAWLVVCAASAGSVGDLGRVSGVALGAGIAAFGVHAMFSMPMASAPVAVLFWLWIGLAARPVQMKRVQQAEGPMPAPGGSSGMPWKRFVLAMAAAAAFLGVRLFGGAIYSREGRLLLEDGNWKEARVYFGKAGALNWDDRRDLYMEAYAMYEEGNPAGSAAALEREIANNPYYADSYADLGSALGSMGRVSEAESRLQTAVSLNPANAEAWYRLGVAFLAQNRRQEAAAAFERALVLAPEYGDAKQGLAAASRPSSRAGQGPPKARSRPPSAPN